MNPDFQLKYEVMSRIKTVRNVWLFTTSPLASALFAGALIFCSSILISFTDVLANIMTQVDWVDRFSYAYSSLLHTRIIVQTVFGLLILSGTMACVNSIRKLRAIIWA